MTVTVVDVNVVELDIVSTSNETTLLSYSVPANTLITSGSLRVRILCDYLNNHATNTSTVTVKIKFGSTTMYDDATIAFPAATATRYPIVMDFNLFAKNATNSQGLSGYIQIGQTGGATTGLAGNLASDEINAFTPITGANAAEDTTAATTFLVTITNQVSDTLVSFRRMYSTIESVALVTRLSTPFIYRYSILSRVSLSRIYRYSILSRVSLSQIYRYTITGRVSLSQIYRYSIQARVSLSQIYRYGILSRVSLSQIYRYTITGRVSLSQIYRYSIQSRVSLSQIYRYGILSRVSLSQIYRYSILARVSLSRIYRYSILARVSLSRIYRYKISTVRSGQAGSQLRHKFTRILH